MMIQSIWLDLGFVNKIGGNAARRRTAEKTSKWFLGEDEGRE
jgi:hypothetical protein